MAERKRVCVIYVSATASDKAVLRERLEQLGHEVRDHEVTVEQAQAISDDGANLPPEILDCITWAEECVVLLPEAPAYDSGLGGVAAAAESRGKPILGVTCGTRTDAPPIFEEHGQAVLPLNSPRLPDAINGCEVFENPDCTPRERRKIDHIKCQ